VKLTENFSLDEVHCNSGESCPPEYVANARALAQDVLQPLRVRWGAPIIITSWWRSQAWNERCGGAQASTHLTADGADIRPVQLEMVNLFHALILRMYEAGQLPGLGGLGNYPGRWVHVDRRRVPGRLRRWTGKGVGSEQA
jgi:uncharacterized protein YcbK (DUF882 family)